MSDSYKQGVSVVICCHNSADKITSTLQHLQRQVLPDWIPWEIVLVNNSSSDKTVETARSVWGEAPITELHIVSEDRMGLVYARLRGLDKARYEFVSFVDDDNWLAEDWVSVLYSLMTKHSQIGACGGLNSAVFEETAPNWFKNFERSYAVGEQASAAGDITEKSGVLFGAGLSIRKTAWKHLLVNGFSFSSVGRQGSKLLCGEDYELCFAIKLAGWKIWYEPRLKLQHYMPNQRLNWAYLRRMLRGVGESDTNLLPYYYVQNRSHEKSKLLWIRQLVRNLMFLTRNLSKMFLMNFRSYEGDAEVLRLERSLGLVRGLVRQNRKFDQRVFQIENSSWIRF